MSLISSRLLDDPEDDRLQRQSSNFRTTIGLTVAALSVALFCVVATCTPRPGAIEAAFLGTSLPQNWYVGMRAPWNNSAFEVRMSFKMPYIDFAQDVYVHSDEPGARMRVSYYSGANVGLINAMPNEMSYELNPVGIQLSCLKTPNVGRLEHILPDLDIFLQNGKHRTIELVDDNGIKSVGIEFILDTKEPELAKDGHYEYFETFGSWIYQGHYTFVINASAFGAPVKAKFTGHNVFLVNSHKDDYVIDYKSFYFRPNGIDDAFFMPPHGMPCIPFSNAVGPFLHERFYKNLAMVIPSRGNQKDSDLLREVSKHLNRSLRSASEHEMRHRSAVQTFQVIQAHNLKGLKYSLQPNHMLDWTAHEKKHLLGRRSASKDTFTLDAESLINCQSWDGADVASSSLPEAIDWRDHGLVTRVKDQGQCGSCWAFGVVGTIEGQLAKRLKRALSDQEILSEQHLIDCSWPQGNMGCDGGDGSNAMRWLLKFNDGRLATDDTYGHYLDNDGFCQFDKSRNLVAGEGSHLTGLAIRSHAIKSCYHVVASHDDKMALTLRKALATQGPIAISINADVPDFYYYASGVYDNPECAPTLNHIVLLVAYGEDKGEKYWTIKNSWSTHWGEKGYGRIAQIGNLCGVLSEPTFALM